IPGLYALGEANFSDHGANRLGASALMQGLADGYFILPVTIGDFLADHRPDGLTTDHPAFAAAVREVNDQIKRLLSIRGKKTVRQFHWELGRIMWDYVGMSRNAQGLQKAISDIQALREEFWRDVKVVGEANDYNKDLEYAGRVADFLELGELMAMDALDREESCGGHFREEYQTPDGEALRRDDLFSHVSVWEYKGEIKDSVRHKEPLVFEYAKPSQRSYK
ncbi:MAG: fumarate reductase/succinate dehydrogenase flavoprotein subunit, partial [Bacillota bacterium]